MKKASALLLMLFTAVGLSFCSIFSGYDFSFFNSVAESIAVSDSERIGIDYSGYGYLGDMTTGIFLRLGLQAPYSTLLNTLDDVMDSFSDTSGTQGQDQSTMDNNDLESKTKDYTFLVALGPAFRRLISPTLSWYMGFGIKVQINNTTISSGSTAKDITLTYIGATDIDIGFRITADIHTTLRIGAYITRPLFTLSQNYQTRDGVDSESEFTFIQNIYPDLNKRDNSTSITGYIAYGHTYASYLRHTPMRYIITSRTAGEGRLEEM